MQPISKAWIILSTQSITDEDILALVNDEVHQPPPIMVLTDLQASICHHDSVLMA